MTFPNACTRPDLWSELQEAAAAPERADLAALWQVVAAAIALVPEAQRLRVAGEAILQLASVCEARAQSLLEAWEQAQRTGSPVTAEGLAELLVRQSMQVDFSDLLMIPAYKYNRGDDANGEESGDSIAGPADKEAILEAFETVIELVEAQAEAASEAISVAHAEDVSAWAGAIARMLQQRSSNGPVSLLELQKGLGMPLVKVWIGLLLGEKALILTQQNQFYDPSGIYVTYLSK